MIKLDMQKNFFVSNPFREAHNASGLLRGLMEGHLGAAKGMESNPLWKSLAMGIEWGGMRK